MSLAVLARKAGIGKSTIFNLERAQGSPAIDTLWSLARALEVPIGALFVDTALADVRVMHRDEAPVLVGEVSHPTARDGRHHDHAGIGSQAFVSRHLLSTHQGRQCELYWIDMATGAIHDSAGHTAGLIEHVVAMAGSVVITVDNESISLSAGDRMTFPAERSHRYEIANESAPLLSLLEYVQMTRAARSPAQSGTGRSSRAMSGYLDSSGRDDVRAGGSRKIPVDTPAGTYQVWVKRTGNNPHLRLLLLHGGPGSSHEYLEACDSYLPAAGIEYYYYDQLGSGFSDKPDDPALWEPGRFVDEVEQVRRALGLGRDNFVLYGHSWGGILAIEYALRHQEHLRGLVISNMMSSVPAYNAYAEHVLMPDMDQAALAEVKALEAAGDTGNPRYMGLLTELHYIHHVLRIPAADWPDPVQRSFAHTNQAIYELMQGPSELGIGPDATLARWNRTQELASIDTPTLVIGARHDTMDPAHMRMMAERLPAGRFLLCPDGSHLAMYDDQRAYFTGLINFLHDLELR